MNNPKILSPEVVGLEPIAELKTSYGSMWQVDSGDYTSMVEEVAGAAADSGYYSLSAGMTECMLTRTFADVIENSSVPAPLSEIMPVMSDGDWSSTQTYPVMEQPDLVSAFAPVCCGSGEGPSLTSNLGFKNFHAATFALSWKLCLPEVYKMGYARPGFNPEAMIQEQIAQVVNYASSHLAIHGGNGIDGLLNNPMVGAFWSPLPFSQMNGTDILAVLSAAVSSLDPNNMPRNGYTLYLPTRTWQRLGMTPYSAMNPAKLTSIISGGCQCPDEVGNLQGMITAVKPLEMLRGAVDVASGDIGLILPNENASGSAAGASAYWYRPVPMMPMEVQQMGLSRYGTVLVHTGDVIAKRPRQMLKIYNV
jgi:hypothetical protein